MYVIDTRPPTTTAPGFADVPVLPWPGCGDERHRFLIARRPRILTVAEGLEPPLITDDLEDWIRVTAGSDELALRQQTLQQRWLTRRGHLWLDEHSLLHSRDRWVSLSDAQAAPAALLIARMGQVVRRDDLRLAYEGVVGKRSANAFGCMLGRLRSSFAELDVTLHSLSCGRLLLELGSSSRGATTETLP